MGFTLQRESPETLNFCSQGLGHGLLPLVQVSLVTQEPPRRLKPSLHLMQVPLEPSQAEQWSSHLGTRPRSAEPVAQNGENTES